MKRVSGKTVSCLVLILLAGGLFRFYGLRVGLPFEFHVDEWFIVRSALEMYRSGSLKPHGYDYPSLIYYLLLAGAHLVGLFKETQSYDLHLFGRAMSACFGVATIAVVYLTGRRAYGEKTGLLAAAFYACTVTALRESHYSTTDSLNTFCIALAVYFIVKIGLGDAERNYLFAAVAVGLAAGSKYNGAFLSLPLLAAHAARIKGSAGAPAGVASGWKADARRLFSGWLVAAALLSFGVFLLTTPYAVIDSAGFLKDLNKTSNALSRKIVEANHHYISTTPYWYYIENLLFYAMNPLLEAACLLGFLYALYRHRRQDIIIAVWLVVYFYVVGGWLNKAVRYTLPMLPFLTLFGAAMFVELRAEFARRGRRKTSLLITALALLTLASAFLYSLAYMSIYARPHPYLEATRWAFENIPAGSTILLEGPTAQERPPVDGHVLIEGGALDFDPQRYRFAYLDVSKLIQKDTGAAQLRAQLAETLAGVDYIIMSMRWYEGLVDSPEASPVIKDYYKSLTDGSSDFEMVKEMTSYPRLFGLEFRDDAAELNFRIFDHPKVWIFRRKALSR